MASRSYRLRCGHYFLYRCYCHRHRHRHRDRHRHHGSRFRFRIRFRRCGHQFARRTTSFLAARKIGLQYFSLKTCHRF